MATQGQVWAVSKSNCRQRLLRDLRVRQPQPESMSRGEADLIAMTISRVRDLKRGLSTNQQGGRYRMMRYTHDGALRQGLKRLTFSRRR